MMGLSRVYSYSITVGERGITIVKTLARLERSVFSQLISTARWCFVARNQRTEFGHCLLRTSQLYFPYMVRWVQLLSYRDFRIPWNVAGTSRGLLSGDASMDCAFHMKSFAWCTCFESCLATHACRLATHLYP